MFLFPGQSARATTGEKLNIVAATAGSGTDDGIDIVSSRYVTVKNCNISTSDDAIVVKVTQVVRDSYDITVENCILASCTNGLKIGTETEGNITNVTFRNCKVYNPVGGPGPEGGVSIEMTDGYMLDTVTVQGIEIQNARSQSLLSWETEMQGLVPD